jgi:hypothetical protein
MKELLKSLHKAKTEIGKVTKNATNPHFKQSYADINALIETVEPILLNNGLLLLQTIKDGKQKSVIYHVESGENIESEIDLPTSGTAQAMGSAITYYRRYTLQSLLTLQAEDDDGHKASEKPPFTRELFQKAKDAGASLDAVKMKYFVSDAIGKEYTLFK